MEQKKGFALRDIMIAMIVVSGVIAIWVLGVNSLANDYSQDGIIDPKFSEDFDKFEEQTDKAGEIYSEVRDKKGLSFAGAFDVLFTATFVVFELLWDSLDIFTAQLGSINNYFQLDAGVMGIAILLASVVITIIIVFTILSSVSRRDL